MTLQNCNIPTEGWLNFYCNSRREQFAMNQDCQQNLDELLLPAKAKKNVSFGTFIGRECEYYYSKFHLLIRIQFAWIICVRIFIFEQDNNQFNSPRIQMQPG